MIVKFDTRFVITTKTYSNNRSNSGSRMIKNLLIYVFKSACIFVTIVMVVVWIYKFYLNDDSTTIEYKLVNDINDIVQPELSINILDPIMNDELQNTLNITKDDTLHLKYKDYLNGNETDAETFKAVDYDQVTPNVFKYLEKIDFFWKRKLMVINFILS